MKGLTLLLMLTSPAQGACHHYSVWSYPYPQRCPVHMAQIEAPKPPQKPAALEPPDLPAIDIPLPSLENMDFPPDPTDDAGRHLKGVGLLRQYYGTN